MTKTTSRTLLLSQYSSSTVWEVEGRSTFTTKKNETFNHLQRRDHFFGVFVTCQYSCCNSASFDVGYVSVDPGEGELPSPES